MREINPAVLDFPRHIVLLSTWPGILVKGTEEVLILHFPWWVKKTQPFYFPLSNRSNFLPVALWEPWKGDNNVKRFSGRNEMESPGNPGYRCHTCCKLNNLTKQCQTIEKEERTVKGASVLIWMSRWHPGHKHDMCEIWEGRKIGAAHGIFSKNSWNGFKISSQR